MRGWQDEVACPVEILPDDRFLCSLSDFRHWAGARRSLRMEFFYRDMRRRHALLLDDNEPVGGRWNYDAENRKRLPPGIEIPDPPGFKPDAITRDVIALVEREFAGHFGTTDGFSLPVTASDAALVLERFIAERLRGFGDWQDAMKHGNATLFHALVSTSLNLGLLDPLDACRAAEAAYRNGQAPLAATEGFIRQIAGWREYVRGIYWLHMPEYATRNALEAVRPLPDLYWTGKTDMRCMADAIATTRDNAYAHHIQRLMITGNFALLTIVYADAYEWVEMPNPRGMALYADGGVMGSKPYAASGAYINRMSDYCNKCQYDVKRSTGEGACPFNFLYWDFMSRHEKTLSGNQRMAMPLRTISRMDRQKRDDLKAEARQFFERMDRGLSI
jgi:deoxyribodipyrimidine photolyase-related protein